MIKLTVEGQVYEFDDQKMLVAEAREIKTLTGLTVPKLFAGIDDGDADAIAALVFLAKKRTGETLRFSDLDTLDLADVNLDVVQPPVDTESTEQAVQDVHEAAVAAVAAAADPTQPSASGATPTDGTGATSVPSPTTSSTPLPTSAP
ncbi:hypothetical protein [Streptomyces cylindrosporus]|uniref:Tail assembly chaperone n=1 Tax=Streptomyces cylindrosporus TaxID=2927583 RepID=A0ABS9YJU3_9ACTN|nr:hypothetical protein [Streptomyces cylindrosporus]MCI3277528.1 hypothetical protein [Streptomyces cylindrosporus]